MVSDLRFIKYLVIKDTQLEKWIQISFVHFIVFDPEVKMFSVASSLLEKYSEIEKMNFHLKKKKKDINLLFISI